MRNTAIAMFTAAVVIVSGCRHQTEDVVYLGQLFNTFGHATQERINGKVKVLKQTNFVADEKNGKVVKGRVFNNEDWKATPLGRDFREEYNISGGVIRSTSYDESGKVMLDVRAEADGRILTGSEYYMNNELRYKVTYRYEGDRLVEALANDPDTDTLITKVKYEYDEKEYILKVQNFDFADFPQDYTLFDRNEKGHPVKVLIYNKEGQLTSLHDYFFNNKGERIGQHEENFNSGVILDLTFMYEYDRKGNYTAIIYSKNGKPLIYREREITYYE
jgi:hypothetical protein